MGPGERYVNLFKKLLGLDATYEALCANPDLVKEVLNDLTAESKKGKVLTIFLMLLANGLRNDQEVACEPEPVHHR